MDISSLQSPQINYPKTDLEQLKTDTPNNLEAEKVRLKKRPKNLSHFLHINF